MNSETIQAAPIQQAYRDPTRPELVNHDPVFAWISLVLAYLYIKFTIANQPGLAASALFITVFACSAVYVIKCGCRPTASQWVLGAVICCFSAVFSITANSFICFLCKMFIIAAQFWWVEAVCVKASFVTKFFAFDLLRTVFVQPIRDAGGIFRAIAVSMKGGRKTGNVRSVIIGLLLALPLTVVVGVLLSQADDSIERIINDLLLSASTRDLFSELMQAAFAIPVSIFIFGMLRANAKEKLYPLPSDVYYNEKITHLKKIDNVGIYAGVLPICVLYVIYIVSQTGYFLSAFAGKLPEGMDYSEYARRGFFELCAVAVINLAVIVFMLAFAKKSGSERTKPLTFFTCMLCGFTLFIISTALAKMILYVDAFGLTRLRLYTSWFMVLLAVIFVTIAIRAFVKRLPTSKILSTAFIVLFAVLCFSRPDALIAEYNITRYEQGTLETLDVDMLYCLSEDAHAVMLEHRDTIEKCDTYSDFKYTPGYYPDYSDA